MSKPQLAKPEFRYPAPTLEANKNTGKDYYKTHTGRYAIRVSTLAKGGKKFDPRIWREQCGGEHRRQLNSDILLDSGTLMHSELEYFIEEGDYPEWIYFPVRDAAENIDPALDQNLKDWIATEQPVSNLDGTIAGTIDLIGHFGYPNGEQPLSIIDYKTSSKKKRASDIKNYFLQATIYATLWEQMTGQHIEQIVILMVIVKGNIRVEYVRNRADFQAEADRLIKQHEESQR